MNPAEFTKRWVNAMKNLSPANQIKGLISGAIGNIIGFSGGIITMLYFVIAKKQYQWWWTVLILIIALFTTVIELVSKKQQLKQMIDVDNQLSVLEGAKLE